MDRSGRKRFFVGGSNNSSKANANPRGGHRVRPGLETLEDRIVPTGTPLYPDLIGLADQSSGYLYGWTIDTTTQPGHTLLRLTSTEANAGDGPLELHGGATDPTTGTQEVWQWIYNTDGTHTEHLAGHFVWHPTHGHFHFDNIAAYRLRAVNPDGSVGAILATGGKTSFCLIDIDHFSGRTYTDPTGTHTYPVIPNSPANGVYESCGNVMQGISVGWADVYGSGLDGQFIDVTGIANGTYYLEDELDPDQHLLMANTHSHITDILINLTGVPSNRLNVDSSTPIGATVGPVNSIEVTFNRSIDPTTFTTADVNFTGPGGAIPITGITAVAGSSNKQFILSFATQGQAATYNYTILPNIQDTSGGLMEHQYFATFAITSPDVIASSPIITGTNAVSGVELTYSEPMLSSTFTLGDIVSFTGPGGTNLLSSISGITPVSAGATSAKFDIFFATQTTVGTYNLVISPNVSDPYGNTVDQNQDGIPNETNDRYTASFGIRLFGPDGFGYTGSIFPFENHDIAGLPGTFTIITTADDQSNPVNLGGGAFNFYGRTYTGANQLYISSNGLITFGSGNSEYSNTDLSAGDPSQAAIAPLWDDLITGTSNPMLIGRFEDSNGNAVSAPASASRLVIEWNHVFHYYSSPNGMTFQAILQLNTGTTAGAITFNYFDLDSGDSNANAASATVGLKDAGTQGANRLLVSFNATSPFVHGGTALRFVGPAPVVSSIVRKGPSLTNAASVSYTVTFSESVTGVDATDFALANTGGVTGDSIADVTGSGNVYTVTVNTGSGSGTLRLDLIDNGSIINASGVPLDGAGNGNFTGEVYTIDKSPPNTTITSKPPAFSNSTSAAFSFTGSDNLSAKANLTFQVSLDGSAFTAATSVKTYTGLSQGTHTFRVRAIDQAGNIDPTPASCTWIVDTTAPVTQITSEPGAVTSDTTAVFTFTGTDNLSAKKNLAFQVSLDGAAFSTATSPVTYVGLSLGSHTFQVRAIDQAGNVDATPATYTWTINAVQPGYIVLDLGTLGGSFSYAYALNRLGDVVGYSQTGGTGYNYHAFLYTNGQMIDLGTLGGTYSIATGINDLGQVVGYSTAADGTYHAFLYASGTMTDLGNFGGIYAIPMGINNAGQIVGYKIDADYSYHAFIDTNGTLTDLGTLGGTYTIPYAINDWGEATGYASVAGYNYHAFRYSGGALADLGTLDGGSYSIGMDINNAGQVVGYSNTGSGSYHAFISGGSGLTDLGTLGGGYSIAEGLNNLGQVVGYSATAANAYHPFLYTGGTMIDLTALLPTTGATPSYVKDINDVGQIIGYGNNGSGQYHALLLTPNTAQLLRLDATTRGTWEGHYGADGYSVFLDSTSYPSYADVSVSGASTYTWNGSTSDVRALQKGAAGSTDRIAATYYSSTSFTIDINFTDGQTHQVAAYFLDWDGNNSRSERVDVIDPVTHQVLSSQIVSSFSGGEYLVWNLSGHVQIQVTNLGGWNAVMSGLFFN
jgi:probable HAF family extracellular repeat protein